MKRKLILLGVFVTLLLATLAACKSEKVEAFQSTDITKDNLAQVCAVLNEAVLFNVARFEKWVLDFAAGMVESESSGSGFSDADCRMTVMLLAGNLIKYDSLEESYEGTYLMFDVDAIENNPEFSLLKDKKALFTTMFGEMPISKNGFSETLPENWRKHGIRVESDRCSVISILFKAYEEETAFVGHTGLLIDCSFLEAAESKFLFVEKIAFTEPFKVTPIQDERELVAMLASRPDYTVEAGEPAPVVYKNHEQIGKLSTGE